jgi:hypothetical protein
LAIADFALKFRRAEALARVKGRNPLREAMAVVIGTGEVGREIIEEFEVADADRPQIAALADALAKVLAKSGAQRSVVLAALAQTGLSTLAGDHGPLREAS